MVFDIEYSCIELKLDMFHNLSLSLIFILFFLQKMFTMIAFLFVWADKQHNTYLDKYVFPTLKIQTSPIFLGPSVV